MKGEIAMEPNTYCGRDCGTCTKKEAMGCPGCRIGPGRMIDGDCELAKCCRNKGHKTCATCTSNRRCWMYNNRANAAEERLKRRQNEQNRLIDLAHNAKEMKGWFQWLFWLSLANLLGTILTHELLESAYSITYYPGVILLLGSKIAYFVLLFIMAKQEEMYRKAGIFLVITTVVAGITSLLGEGGKALGLLLALPLVVVEVLAVYYEFNAHSVLFEEVDTEICENWLLLWKLYLVTYCATIGGVLLVFVSAGLALVVMIIGALGLVIVGILRQVLLYRSAKKAHYFSMYVLES